MRPDASEQGCNSLNVKNAILDSGKQQSLGSMQQMTKKMQHGARKVLKNGKSAILHSGTKNFRVHCTIT